MVNHQWRRMEINLPKILAWGLTFLSVMICWVFFRAESVGSAWSILCAMTGVGNVALPAGGAYERYLGFLQDFGVRFIPWGANSLTKQILLIFVIAMLLFLPNVPQTMERFRPNRVWLVAFVVLFLYAILQLGSETEFLYFQF